MHEKKIENISALSPQERTNYFIRKVCDFESVWGLFSESGWVTSVSKLGSIGFPVWPESSFASACANGEWTGTTPKEIFLQDFIEKWLPGLSSDSRYVAVFPVPNSQHQEVPPLTLQNQLCSELQQYE